MTRQAVLQLVSDYLDDYIERHMAFIVPELLRFCEKDYAWFVGLCWTEILARQRWKEFRMRCMARQIDDALERACAGGGW